MSGSIRFEVVGGMKLASARPDGLWCELVRVFVPGKSKETGDFDPYGVASIMLHPSDGPALWSMARSFQELSAIAKIVEDGAAVVMVREA